MVSIGNNAIELRLLDKQPTEPPVSGFGMLKSNRRAVPADFDPATLLNLGDGS